MIEIIYVKNEIRAAERSKNILKNNGDHWQSE